MSETPASIIDTQSLPGLGIKPELSLKRHQRAAVAAAVLVLVIGTPFAWIKGKSSYTAESVFQVAPSFMKNLESDRELDLQSNSQYREYVNHLSNSVVRRDVLQRALESLRLRGIDLRPAALNERKYIEQLRRTVYVRAIPDTYMVRIGSDDAKKEHLHDLINAITESFIDTTRTEQIYGSPQRLQTLQAGGETLRAEIDQLELERIELATRLGLTSFRENAENPYDATLAQAREKANLAAVERIQAEAVITAFRKSREIPTSFGRSLLEMRLQDTGLQSLRSEIIRRSEELQRNTAGLELRHPARQAAAAELELIEQRLKEREAEFDRAVYSNFETRLLASLNQQLQIERNVQIELKHLESQAADFARDFQHAMRLTSDIKKRDAELVHLRDRLNYLSGERGALGFVRLVSAALPAETPQGPGKTRLLLVVLLSALGAAVVVPVLLDLLDRSVRSVNEAEKLVGFAAAGWQVQVNNLPSRLFANEQTRRFAAALIRNRTRGGRNVFAFTAVKAGAGVTATVLDTAAMLAQLGMKVLVVDANTLAPCVGLVDDGPGLTDHLAGRARADELVRACHWRGTALHTVGAGHSLRGGLRRLDLLHTAMAGWSAAHDFVLVDLAPVLLSADAEMLVEALGQVFLVIEAESVSRGEILRAKRLLQRIDPEAVGLFVNRLPVFQGGGYIESLIGETLSGGKPARPSTPWRDALRRPLALLGPRAG